MSSDISVYAQTQKIFVDPASASVSVINAGPQGPAGPPGTGTLAGRIHAGITAPDANTADDGDFYIDTTAHILYGPKSTDPDNIWPIALKSANIPRGPR